MTRRGHSTTCSPSVARADEDCDGAARKAVEVLLVGSAARDRLPHVKAAVVLDARPSELGEGSPREQTKAGLGVVEHAERAVESRRALIGAPSDVRGEIAGTTISIEDAAVTPPSAAR